jgi:hypothetical protein
MPTPDHTERNYWIAGCYRSIQGAVGRQLQTQCEVPKELPHQLLAILVHLAGHPAQGRRNQKGVSKTGRQAFKIDCPVCGRPMTYLHTIRRAFADDLIVLKCNPCGFPTAEIDVK